MQSNDCHVAYSSCHRTIEATRSSHGTFILSVTSFDPVGWTDHVLLVVKVKHPEHFWILIWQDAEACWGSDGLTWAAFFNTEHGVSGLSDCQNCVCVCMFLFCVPIIFDGHGPENIWVPVNRRRLCLATADELWVHRQTVLCYAISAGVVVICHETIGCSPPDSGKAIIFRAKAKFFGQKAVARNGKIYFLCLWNEKTEFILSSEIQCPTSGIFSARQHICYSALYAIARPSVWPSVCLSVTRGDQSKTVEVRITQPLPQSNPMTLVSWRRTAPWNSNGKIGSGGAKYERGMKNTQFSANNSPYLGNGAR